jgi:hypothetical protein
VRVFSGLLPSRRPVEASIGFLDNTPSSKRWIVADCADMRKLILVTAVALVIAGRAQAAGPSFVDITWMSISNVYYEALGFQ